MRSLQKEQQLKVLT